MTAAARTERRSGVLAVAAAVLLVAAMWLAAVAASSLPASRGASGDPPPRGPVLSPQRWHVDTAGAPQVVVGPLVAWEAHRLATT